MKAVLWLCITFFAYATRARHDRSDELFRVHHYQDPATPRMVAPISFAISSAFAETTMFPNSYRSKENYPGVENGKPHESLLVETLAERIWKVVRGNGIRYHLGEPTSGPRNSEAEPRKRNLLSSLDLRSTPVQSDNAMSDRYGPIPNEGTPNIEEPSGAFQQSTVKGLALSTRSRKDQKFYEVTEVSPTAREASFSREDNISQPFHSFIMSLAMIVLSEVGDKTFLVAALMSMRHPRIQVFSAAMSALWAMTVLSTILGHTAPKLIPVELTTSVAAIMFLSFGVRMILEAKSMTLDDDLGEEMKEVEIALDQNAGTRGHSIVMDDYALESGSRRSSILGSYSCLPVRWLYDGEAISGVTNLCFLLLNPAWVQTFLMTFFAEWGDRSQLATIAMAAGTDHWFIGLGAMFGHSICTGAAVLGGRAIAGRVSMRAVTAAGAIAFLLFGFIYVIEAYSLLV